MYVCMYAQSASMALVHSWPAWPECIFDQWHRLELEHPTQEAGVGLLSNKTKLLLLDSLLQEVCIGCRDFFLELTCSLLMAKDGLLGPI